MVSEDAAVSLAKEQGAGLSLKWMQMPPVSQTHWRLAAVVCRVSAKARDGSRGPMASTGILTGERRY